MRSMTGFGIGEALAGAARISVELRSVNHRYCDVRVRLPPDYVDQAFYVEQLARQHLGRGRFDVNVRVYGNVHRTLSLDAERARQIYCDLSALRDELAPGTPVSVTSLLAAPGVFSSTDPDHERDLRAAMGQAMLIAIQELDAMRQREGDSLCSLLQVHVGQARLLVAACHQRSIGMADIYREKMRDRLARLLTESKIQADDTRLEQEIALLAERTDATEELARLASHLDHFAAYLNISEPVGRRLDFLLQEIAREANTLGAKCQDSDLSLMVVELKAETERMREQVQNVE
jgi:uncharacterized protein (TIGR00255 family)